MEYSEIMYFYYQADRVGFLAKILTFLWFFNKIESQDLEKTQEFHDFGKKSIIIRKSQDFGTICNIVQKIPISWQENLDCTRWEKNIYSSDFN